MKALKIMIVMLILIMSVGAVCAAESISDDAMGDDSKEILETVQEDITTDDSADILKTAQNDIYTAGDDSFTNLTDEIKSKDVVDLTHDSELLLGRIILYLTVTAVQLTGKTNQEYSTLPQTM